MSCAQGPCAAHGDHPPDPLTAHLPTRTNVTIRSAAGTKLICFQSVPPAMDQP